ncbi:MAG TPA: glycosyltransferase family 2 protein [Shinella sp.]|uniref:glycosyltransferase family 2 protein n=1 Tax=Shinella sp. TaxID=1870904 RepID=UPI002E0ED4FC|nr:glycosyltransferase family 2 protein [Shinella sp.]
MSISLIVPIYNEEATIPIFYAAVRSEDTLKNESIEIVFVNDGSKDHSAEIVQQIMSTDPLVQLVDFTRNFGKEPALFAGLAYAKGDAVIPIDVDLQDPIELIPKMLEKWRCGAEVVLAKRQDRSSDNFLKRRTAQAFYAVHNFISDTRIEENVGDFRLISRPIVDEILLLPERNLFMKGLLSWVGGRTEVVEYRRAQRVAGTTKFNGWKLWNLALEGITSFSTMPLRIWTYIGLFISTIAFIYGAWIVLDKLFFGNSVPGYPSIFAAIMFFGGVQILGIGIIGEYIGRIYRETKMRPRYIVRRSAANQSGPVFPAGFRQKI